jgi:hypothetical protein
MNVYEIMQSSSGAVLSCTNKNQREIATELLRDLLAKAYEEGRKAGAAPLREDTGTHIMTTEILNQVKAAAYEEGGREVLTYLQQLYDGVEDTDIWADFFEEEAGE